MILIGLTGSIGMGKSTVARMLAEMGVPFHDADAAVHSAMEAGGTAVEPVIALFPDVAKTDDHNKVSIDRQKLGQIVFLDPEKMKQLEAILHPLARAGSHDFTEKCKAEGLDFAVLDIPLLFETGADQRVDVTFCVSAPPEVQKERVLSRPGMTEEKFEKILHYQIPDIEKRKRADYVIMTDKGLEDTRQQLQSILQELREKHSEKL